MALSLMHDLSGQSLSALASDFEVSGRVAVSTAVRRFKNRLATDTSLRKHYEAARRLLCAATK